jgi:hypothetical protein
VGIGISILQRAQSLFEDTYVLGAESGLIFRRQTPISRIITIAIENISVWQTLY